LILINDWQDSEKVSDELINAGNMEHEAIDVDLEEELQRANKVK